MNSENKRILSRGNTFAEVNPELLSEWDYDKNIIKPENISKGSNIKVWFKCKNNHEWQSTPKNRTRGRGCPLCFQVNRGYILRLAVIKKSGMTLFDTYPELMKDWDYEKNINLDPNSYSKPSSQIVWWKCKNGHCYNVSIHSRIRSGGCKICSKPIKSENQRKKKLAKGKSFAESKPELLVEWNYDKNNISPENISEKSHFKVWFKCTNNHEWQATPGSRVRGNGCPICYTLQRGEIVRLAKLRKSKLTLFNEFPEIMKEWDYEKNIFNPKELAHKSNEKVWWKCKRGHVWKTTVVNRTSNGSSCPLCNSKSSKLEIFIYCECLKLFNNVKWREKVNGYECDILINNEKVAIEIDGGYWHKNKLKKDILKTNALKKEGIELIRVREDSLPYIEGNVVVFKPNDNYIDIAIKVFSLVNKFIPFDFKSYKLNRKQIGKSQYQKILSYLPSPPKHQSILYKNPTVSKEWDYEKNYPLLPEMFFAGSEQKVFWLCNNNHSWKATIKNRIGRKSGCPICYKEKRGDILRKALLKKTGASLGSDFPSLLTEWDYNKNHLSPYEIAPKSNSKVWWVCEDGHSYSQEISSKTRGHGCPLCASKRLSKSARNVRIKKTGTLDKRFPEIASQWDYIMNETNPTEYPPGSHAKVWWLCSKGHSWKTKICCRTIQKQGCPICYKERRNKQLKK